jgi:hypothetical protein
MDIGTKTCGRDPTVVPSNPAGATPTMVNGFPLIVMVSLTTAGSALKRRVQ